MAIYARTFQMVKIQEKNPYVVSRPQLNLKTHVSFSVSLALPMVYSIRSLQVASVAAGAQDQSYG